MKNDGQHRQRTELTAEIMLRAYASGIFPMSDSRDAAEIFWVDPSDRGILPIEGFHISRSLARDIRRARYQVTVDRAFRAVIDACADRAETWINAEICGLYERLFAAGNAHSIEVWDGEELVGGTYGVCLGKAYFGESMFSRRANTSKIALAYLIARLRVGGYRLFDTQFLTDHLASLGAVEVPRKTYHMLLSDALQGQGDFHAFPKDATPQDVLQFRTQTS